jgi:hypothetical protein
MMSLQEKSQGVLWFHESQSPISSSKNFLWVHLKDLLLIKEGLIGGIRVLGKRQCGVRHLPFLHYSARPVRLLSHTCTVSFLKLEYSITC